MPAFAGWQEGKAWLTETIQSIVARGRMEKEEAERIHLYAMYQFLSSPVAARMRESARKSMLIREQPSVLAVGADRGWPEQSSTSSVLVQGIIDVFWEEEDGLVLLDYKTDRVERAEELLARYETQLLLYKEALDRRFAEQHKQVKEVLIYSFKLGETVVV